MPLELATAFGCKLGRLTYGVLLLAVAVFASSAEAQLYTAEALTRGTNLHGQDGWTYVSGFGGIVARQGTGVNTSTVLAGPSSFTAAYTRNNDASFSIGQFTGLETNAILQIDVSPIFTPLLLFGLGHDSIADADNIVNQSGERGPLFGTDVGRLAIVEAGGGASHVSSMTLSNGSWYRLRLEINFLGNGGSGSGSLWVCNLSIGQTAFTAVPDLQNVSLGLLNTFADVQPATYDAMYVLMTFGDMDNMGVVPEPATSVLILLAVGASVLSRVVTNKRRRGTA